MSKLAQLDCTLHDYFLENDDYRDLSKISKTLKIVGKWMHQKRKNIIIVEGDFLWYWKN